MSVFKEHGERKDALVEKLKAAAARRDRHAQEAAAAESERVEYERQFIAEDKAQRASYDQVVQFIASLAPLPRLVTDTVAALAEKAAQEAAEAAPEVPAPDAPAEAETPPDAAPEPQTEPVAEAAPDPFNIQPRE